MSQKTDKFPLFIRAAFFFVFYLINPAGFCEDEETENAARWDFVKYTFEVKGEKVYEKKHRKLTVLNPRGDVFAKLAFDESSFKKIKKLRIDFKDADDKTSKSTDLKDLKKQCGYGADYAVYHDICQYYYSITSPKHPYSIEILEEIEYLNAFTFRGAVLPTKIPITSSVCSLVCPIQTPFRYKSYALPLSISETFSGSNKIVVWTGENIEPPDFDTLSALDYELAGEISVVIDEFKFINSAYSGGTWPDVGRWYAELLRKRYGWESIKPMSAPDRNAFDICRETYDKVIGDFRYVSISIGVSGWQPRLIKDIEKTKYGDCKDLSMMLVDELRANGVETYPVLILTRGNSLIDPEFPSFGFNHLIAVAVSGNDSLWMDPTCRSCPFGQIPWSDQLTYALIITDTAGVLVHTPRSPAEDNQIVRKVNSTIGPDQRLYSEITMDFTGQLGSSFRESFTHSTKPEQLEFVESYLSGKSAAYKLKDYSVENLNDIYAALRLNISAVSINPIRKVGKVLYIDPCVVEPSLNLSITDYVRSRPMKFKYSYSIVDSVSINFDSAMAIESIALPAADYNSELGSWRISSSLISEGSNKVAVILNRNLEEIFISPDKFELLKEFDAALSNRDSRMVKVYMR